MEISESIIKQIDRGMEYLNRRNDMMATFGGILRLDRLDYDITGLREGIINVILHRKYRFTLYKIC